MVKEVVAHEVDVALIAGVVQAHILVQEMCIRDRAPAKAISLDHEIGSIEPGKCADLVVLDRDLNLKAVYIDGKRAV